MSAEFGGHHNDGFSDDPTQRWSPWYSGEADDDVNGPFAGAYEANEQSASTPLPGALLEQKIADARAILEGTPGFTSEWYAHIDQNTGNIHWEKIKR